MVGAQLYVKFASGEVRELMQHMGASALNDCCALQRAHMRHGKLTPECMVLYHGTMRRRRLD